MSVRSYVLAVTERSGIVAATVYDDRGGSMGEARRDLRREASESNTTPDLDAWLSGAISVMEAALRRAEVSSQDIVATGFASSSRSLALWDHVTGQPYAYARTPLGWDEWAAETQTQWLTAWIAEEVSDDVASAVKPQRQLRIGSLHSWWIWNLTQGARYVIDVSHDIAPVLATSAPSDMPFGIAGLALPTVIDKVGLIGRTATVYFGGARLPITAVASIQAAALVGAGLDALDDAWMSFEADGFVSRWVADSRSGTGVRRALANPWSLHGFVQWRRYAVPQAMLLWMQRSLLLDGEDLVAVENALWEAGPLWVPMSADAIETASIVNITPETTPSALYAAGLRALAYSVAKHVEQVDTTSTQRALCTDDAGFGLPSLYSLQAAIAKRPVYVQNGDAITLGTAMYAAMGAELWNRSDVSEILDAQLSMQRYDIPDLKQELSDEFSKWKHFSSAADVDPVV